jgi:hypothetical protein
MPDESNDTRSLAALVQPGRVHRRLYTDPAIFELEMSRLFSRWRVAVCRPRVAGARGR